MQKRNRPFILMMFTFLLIAVSDAIAGNYVKIATVGKEPIINETAVSQKMVDQVINFWKLQIQQVIYDKPDLIVLPEYSDIPSGLGYGDKRKEYIKIRGEQVSDYFASVAKSNHCYIAFGTLREDAARNLWNSVILLDRTGQLAGIYNKNFPTIYEMEMGVKAGAETPIFQCDFGRVGLVLCFDLNFDELREKYAALKPDIMLMCSSYHGGFVQEEWAYSCRSFFVGCVSGGGHSEIRDPLGDIIASSTNYFDYAVANVNLDARLVHLDYNEQRLKDLKKKYGNAVTIKDPGLIGAVLVSSNDANTPVNQMIREFGIELLDQYFDRSRQYRLSHEIAK